MDESDMSVARMDLGGQSGGMATALANSFRMVCTDESPHP